MLWGNVFQLFPNKSGNIPKYSQIIVKFRDSSLYLTKFFKNRHTIKLFWKTFMQCCISKKKIAKREKLENIHQNRK